MRRWSRRIWIALAILAATHAYIWWRLVDRAELPAPWHALASAAVVVLAPCLPIAVLGFRGMPRDVKRPYLRVLYTAFALSLYLLLGAAASHVATAFGANPRSAALVCAALAGAVVVYGLVHVARGPVVRRVHVPLARLPADAAGYTIVQITDLHIGALLGRAYAERVVARVAALSPDLVVLTGDLVDGRVGDLAPHVEPLRELRARDGVYAVTGNHEYYWNADAWIAHLATLGIRTLRNERVALRGAFELAGVDDSSARGMAHGHGEDIPRATAGRDPARPLVLLAHHPHSITGAIAAGVDLQLSGHTHGGQLLPLGWLSRLFEPRVAGLGRFGDTWLYVSEGTGFWGPPLRVGTSCEIAVVTLVCG
ncbi:MAG TPA: metallophosphoesterase [Kofleriaceae bacterium]|nr:metallophosphoesterase [Kofleriaceae bacterium]